MFGLSMQILAPVFGFGLVVFFISAGVVMVRVLTAKYMGPEPGSLADKARAQRLEDMEARLGEVDSLKERLGDMEERLDFTERMLAKQREAPRIGPEAAREG